MPDVFVDVRDAGHLAGVSARTVTRWLTENRLQRYRSGSFTRINRAELLAHIEPRPRKPADIDRAFDGVPFVVCIARDEGATRYDLVDISEGPSLPEARAELESRGRVFVGAIGFRQGVPVSRLAEPVPDEIVQMLASSCVTYLSGRLESLYQRLGLASAPNSSERVQ